MPARKSAFVKAGASAKDVVKEASQTVRNNMLDDSEIIESLEMKNGSRVSVICKVGRVICDVHDEDKENIGGQPFVSFVFVPTKGPLKGGTLSNFMPCYDRRNPSDGVDGDAMEWIFRELQGLGFDTEGWGMEDIEEAADEVTDDNPLVSVTVTANAIKSGPRKGQLAVNLRIGRLLEDVEDDTDAEPADDGDDSDDGGNDDGVVASDDSDDSSDGSDFIPAVGSKVLYDYDDEQLECEVTSIDDDGKLTLSDGEYEYDEIDASEVVAAN